MSVCGPGGIVFIHLHEFLSFFFLLRMKKQCKNKEREREINYSMITLSGVLRRRRRENQQKFQRLIN
jgi:hypothetical protein